MIPNVICGVLELFVMFFYVDTLLLMMKERQHCFKKLNVLTMSFMKKTGPVLVIKQKTLLKNY
jgi:hypothetical protein